MAGQKWTYRETQLAFALYYLIPVSEIDKRESDVWRLAEHLGRTPRSVAMKLWNIAAFDENRMAQGKAGLKHGSALDAKMWEDYRIRGDDFILESVELLTSVLDGVKNRSLVDYAALDLRVGWDRVGQTKHRVNQQYFRNTLMDNYAGQCCLTGLAVPKLLVASHIKPWAACEEGPDRVNPKNGLLLNAFHDRAFDAGLITLSRNKEIIVSKTVPHNDPNDSWLWSYEKATIALPKCNEPALEFIEYHQDCVFAG